jgi:MinD superfamily P-loop ATPase
MKELVIISGKGGTGKTSLVSAFAAMSENKALCDADVDAADLHLIMAPDVKERHDFQSGHTAIIDHEKCTQCGTCTNLCRFDAISDDFIVDPMACEGCGVCHFFCPEDAIGFPLNTCGQWFVSGTRFGPMVHAALGIAEENSGKLVTLVRQEAAKLAEKLDLPLLITDGPPGIGCPVIAAIGGASTVLIVTEPTVSGIHDMQRVVELAAHFKVPAMVSVNKYDINIEITAQIESHSLNNGLFLAGNIPFDPAFTKAMVEGRTLFEYNADSQAAQAVKTIWEKVTQKIGV